MATKKNKKKQTKSSSVIIDKNIEEIIANNQAKRYEPNKEVRVKIYDFKRPDKFSKDQIRTIQMPSFS